MYAALLPPAIRQPLGRLDRVAIIADPSLNDIPFCALRSPDGSYLVEDLEISFIPSVTGLLTLESGLGRRTRSGMSEPLVIGLSSFPGTYAQLPPLPYAAAEANMVAECLGLSGPLRPEDATRAVFLERGRAARVIHLATHAVVNECSPELSFLALADGPLSVRDLYLHSNSQSLGSTLVVLSACETARGTSRGDSVASLTNALLVAGASTVVSPVWPIVDQASAAFMERFYLELEGGTDVPAALRSAQLKLLAKERSSNPLYWAAFRVTGCRESPFAAPSQ
jgi:CHAT domain-containing protein